MYIVLNYRYICQKEKFKPMKNLRKLGMTIVAVLMCAGAASCTENNPSGENSTISPNPDTNGGNGSNDSQENPIAGTVWEWSDQYVRWTFTFTSDEVIFKYENFDSGLTEEYKSSYTYAPNTVTFIMNGWSGIVWNYTGTVSGNTMHLVDSGTEKMEVDLTRN